MIFKEPTNRSHPIPALLLHSFTGAYVVATISRLLKMINLFCGISSLLQGSFTKATYNFKEPINRSHPIAICSVSGNVEYKYPYAMYIATYT